MCECMFCKVVYAVTVSVCSHVHTRASVLLHGAVCMCVRKVSSRGGGGGGLFFGRAADVQLNPFLTEPCEIGRAHV